MSILRDNPVRRRLGEEYALYKMRHSPVVVGDRPYLDDDTFDFFQTALRSATGYLEYGSGGSTVVASGLGVPGIAIETDARFAAAVQDKVGQASSMRVHPVDIGAVGFWGIPRDKRLSEVNRQRWERYVRSGWDFWQASGRPEPSLVMIDGRFRVATALLSLHKLGPGGDGLVLVDDYTVRPHYWVLEALADCQSIQGRSAAFTIDPRQYDRLPEAISDFTMDWR